MVRVLDLLAVEPTIVDARHDVAAAGRARRRVPRRVVRLRNERRRAVVARSDVDLEHRRRPLGRRRRAHRQRQDDVLAPAAAPRRGDRRAPSSLGGVPIARHPAGRAAPPRRARAAGGRAVRGHDPRQRHAVRPDADRRRRRSTRCAASASTRSPTPASTAPSAPAAPGCRPARRSCWRWPGCGCASPTSSCSTRRRRASTRSPSSAWRPPSPSCIEGRTTLIIAHKLSTLRMVDEIIVFDHGRIVEHDDRDGAGRRRAAAATATCSSWPWRWTPTSSRRGR